MTINCTDLDHLLMEGDALAMAAAAKHAETCAACAATLASWNEISATARDLRAGWKNDMLWPRIERAVKRERRRGWTQLLQVAAALAIFAALAAVTWSVVRARQFDNVILRASALDQVEQAEQQHVAAIDRLEKLAEPKLDTPDTPLMVSYKEKLMLLDDAIAECQKGIEQNRNNAHLRKQLLAVYTEKQRTLQDVLREETNHASRQ
jgi:uncharacterized iron-regulated membrane protein